MDEAAVCQSADEIITLDVERGTLLHEEEKLFTQSGLRCDTFDSNCNSVPMVHGTESKKHGRKE